MEDRGEHEGDDWSNAECSQALRGRMLHFEYFFGILEEGRGTTPLIMTNSSSVDNNI